MDSNNSVEKTSENIVQAVVEQEMQKSYLDYAMSVIVGRALPNVRDGLKPVHMRILYAMYKEGLTSTKKYSKSVGVVGEVLKKYHPHGDGAVYDAMVRMAQPWNLRYPLVDGQGNFGSIDGDGAAAYRYTEARMTKLAEELLADIDKDTVDMRDNFDATTKEPTVLPTKIPNLLINGSNGIAVGMATSIPPHNLTEVADALIALVQNEDLESIELAQIVQGPDLPTGGIILGKAGITQAYRSGRGKIKMRAKLHIEEHKDRERIIVTEIPYQVNKSMLIEQIAENVRDKRIESISDIRDESDQKGMRIVIELKKDANTDLIQNQLFKYTKLQTTMGIIFLSIQGGRPCVLNLREMLVEFINHRKEVIKRRTTFDLLKAQKKLHLLEGLTKALDHIDAIIALLKKSSSGPDAKQELQSRYTFSSDQAQAILDMKLQKLTGLEQDQIRTDYEETKSLIAELQSILASEEKIKDIIKTETEEIKEKYGDERRTEIIDVEDEDIDDEDLIPQEQQVVTITKSGYAKRLPLDTYRAQNRGGKGVIGTRMKEEDVVDHLFVANTHSYLLVFTNRGQVHWLKVYKLPEASRQAKGKALVNLIQLQQEEKIAAVIPVESFDQEAYLMLATKNGIIKKTSLEAYSRPRQTGIIGITLDEGDQVVAVRKTTGKDNILIGTYKGQAVHFDEQDARPIGRTSRGVRGVTLEEGDRVIDLIIAHKEASVLTITEKGYGKRTAIAEYRFTNRGGKGVRNIICNERNGNVASVRAVTGNEDVLLISGQGIVIRTKVDQISQIGRNTQGLRIMRLDDGDEVRSTALIREETEEL